jgi:hypothetical protein
VELLRRPVQQLLQESPGDSVDVLEGRGGRRAEDPESVIEDEDIPCVVPLADQNGEILIR